MTPHTRTWSDTLHSNSRTHIHNHAYFFSLSLSLSLSHTASPLQFVALERLPPKEDDDKPGKMYFVSAGADGYIRWWDYETIDDAEVEEGAHFETEPLAELMVGDGVKISSMLRGDDHWIVLDANGAIWKVCVRDRALCRDYMRRDAPIATATTQYARNWNN